LWNAGNYTQGMKDQHGVKLPEKGDRDE